MRRKRKRIPDIQKAAAFAAALLPEAQRTLLRAQRAEARTVLALFTADHIVLHAWRGSDKWWNLDMRLRGPELKQKDAEDTKRVYKAARISEKWKEFVHKLHSKRKRKKKSKWPSRPFNSRRRNHDRTRGLSR